MTRGELLAAVRTQRLPHHVALIMDGNGRWAERRGLPRVEGHRQGMQAAERLIRFVAEERLVPYLSLFAFSTENWNRPQEEVDYLLDLLARFIRERGDEFVEGGIRLRVLGAVEALPPSLQRTIAEIEARSRRGDVLDLAVGINFGGRWSIVEGARRAMALARSDALKPEELDEGAFARLLPTAGLPEPDLIVRTGEEKRISNFYLWEAAYSEFYFTSILWPDFDEDALLAAIQDFQGRRRRFGRVTP
ncbi:di-trans,poly-cis-decaprenylcistransferase [Candidatus Bipolaricaulota bacterium]|nr:di-trans,poly-cis-decaprenylcistransferase [Candidatus Bipolaricaulota bacterium]